MVSLEGVDLRKRFPVTSMCFQADCIITPVMDGGGGIHRFLCIVFDKQKKGGRGGGGGGGEEGGEVDEGQGRMERMKKLVEDKVRKWRDGMRGKRKKKRAKVEPLPKEKPLPAVKECKEEALGGGGGGKSKKLRQK